jgi:hypothetical protein
MCKCTQVLLIYGTNYFKNRMPKRGLHVIRRLVEIPDAGNMILPRLSNDSSIVPNDNCSVPENVGGVTFQNWGNYDHVVPLCQLE